MWRSGKTLETTSVLEAKMQYKVIPHQNFFIIMNVQCSHNFHAPDLFSRSKCQKKEKKLFLKTISITLKCKILTGTSPYLAGAHNFSFNTHTLHIIYITKEKPHYCINNAHEYLVHTTSAQPKRKNNHQLMSTFRRHFL